MFDSSIQLGGKLEGITAPDIGSSRTIFGHEQTRALRPREGEAPVFAFNAVPAGPPVGVLRLRGEEMPPGPPMPGRPHVHDFVALSYFDRPGGFLRLEGERWPVESGDVVLIAPGQVVAFEPDPDAPAPASGWGVIFLPEAFGSSGSGVRLSWRAHPLLFPFVGGAAATAQRLRVPAADRDAWAERIAALWQELRSDQDGHQEAVRAHLTLLLVAVARLAESANAEVRLSDDPLLARVFDVIEQRYGDGISLADVARAVNLTPGHLTTVVRERTGRTVVEWIAERRMSEARRLLAQTGLAVSEVGRRVGYSDPAYFTRAFRRAHQVTPSAWRRSAAR